MSMNTTNNGTYIIVHDNMLCVKAIDLAGEKINITSSDHLVYQKLRHMFDKLKKAGKPCYPSKNWLSCHLGVSERTVADSLNKLRKVGLVQWKKIRLYGNARNLYTVSSILEQNVYIADLKDPVPFEQVQVALKERLQALCEDAPEINELAVSVSIEEAPEITKAQPSKSENDKNPACFQDTASMTPPFLGLVRCLDDDDDF